MKYSQIFSTIDLAKGFLQVPLEEKSRPLTAFSTHAGHFQFKVAPMGLRNSPLTFCRLMNIVLHGLLDDTTLVYLDDILICTGTMERHEEKLRKVFERLRSAGLTINPVKCQFFQEKLEYLGHTISKSGILPNNAKIEAISLYPAPKTPKQVKSFLGLAGFYRPFICKYGAIAAPLSNLLKKDTKWRWGEEEQCAFDTLKQKLVSSPVLIFPDFDQPFHLFTDASNEGLGAALMQQVSGKYQPIAYASRMMNKSERNYNTTDREMLAVVWSLQHFRELIQGYEIIVHTDHSALMTSLTGKDPHGRRSRYQDCLGEFRVKFVHIPGKENGPPDALSRASLKAGPGEIEQNDAASFPPSFVPLSLTGGKSESYSDKLTSNSMPRHRSPKPIQPCTNGQASAIKTCHAVTAEPVTIKTNIEWIEAQATDPVYCDIIQALKSNTQIPKHKGIAVNELCLVNGMLMRHSIPKRIRGRKRVPRQVLVVPEAFVDMVIKYGHEGNGHAGMHKTVRFLREKYFFPKLYHRVSKYIGQCKIRPIHKGNTGAPAKVLTYDVPHKPWHKVSCDTLTFTPSRHGNRYLLVFIDNFSRFAELVVVRDKSAEAVAKAFYDHVICRHGAPSYLMHDNGTEFMNSVLQQLCLSMGVKQVNVLPYRPEANGITERLNRTIIQILRTMVGECYDTWEDLIPTVQTTINGTYHQTLGDTPDFLVSGQDKRMPYDLILHEPIRPLYTGSYAEHATRETQVRWRKAFRHLSTQRDRIIGQQHRLARDKTIGVGARVYHKIGHLDAIRQKLEPRFEGPYRVVSVRNNKCECLCLRTGNTIKYHFDTLKLASEHLQEE